MRETTDGLPVVVGIDDSSPGRRALDWAADEADRRGLPLRIVHATVWARYEGEQRPLSDYVARHAAERVGERRPRVRFTVEVVLDQAEPALLRAAESAALLVLGSRTLGPVAKAVLGSVSLPVVAGARCPVVVVRGVPSRTATAARGGAEAGTGTGTESGSGDGDGEVVLGVDGQEGSAAVARFAFREAAVRGCPVRAVHAWRVPWVEAPAGHAGQLGDARRSRRQAALLRLDEALAPVVAEFPQVPVHRVLAEGHAPESLLEPAAGAALLVVGAHRRQPAHPGRLGPVNHAVLYHAPCPVALVPHG